MKTFNLILFCCTRVSLDKNSEVRFYTRWDLDELQGIAAENKEEANRIARERLITVGEMKKYKHLFGGVKEYEGDRKGCAVFEISPGKKAELRICFGHVDMEGFRPGCRNVVVYCGKSTEIANRVYQEFIKNLEVKEILGYTSEDKTEVVRKDKTGRLWNDVFLSYNEVPEKIPLFSEDGWIYL